MVDWSDTAIGNEVDYATFGCNVFKDDPQTPDLLTPDIELWRVGAKKLDRRAPDGRKIRFWTFRDSDPNKPFQRLVYPAPPMLVKQNHVVHTHLTTSTGPHTIHHHGIEPTTANDGVGHVSFEVGDSYTYQWKPSRPGTFFYHCHRNTTLHFELGMWGPLIVYPQDHNENDKRLYSGGPGYDSEMVWAAHAADPRWHLIEAHDAGLCGIDAGLNIYRPEYFLLSGVWGNQAQFHPQTEVIAQVGERVLIRLINASYTLLRVLFTHDVEIVAADGHSWGRYPWCPSTQTLPARRMIELAPAQRYDFIVEPKNTGNYYVFFEFRDWITNKIHHNGAGRLKGRIRVV